MIAILWSSHTIFSNFSNLTSRYGRHKLKIKRFHVEIQDIGCIFIFYQSEAIGIVEMKSISFSWNILLDVGFSDLVAILTSSLNRRYWLIMLRSGHLGLLKKLSRSTKETFSSSVSTWINRNSWGHPKTWTVTAHLLRNSRHSLWERSLWGTKAWKNDKKFLWYYQTHSNCIKITNMPKSNILLCQKKFEWSSHSYFHFTKSNLANNLWYSHEIFVLKSYQMVLWCIKWNIITTWIGDSHNKIFEKICWGFVKKVLMRKIEKSQANRKRIESSEILTEKS